MTEAGRNSSPSRPVQAVPTVALLLTATIDPGRTPSLKVSSPEERLQDYRLSAGRWLRKSDLFSERIVFENSGHSSVATLRREFGGKFNILTLSGNGDSYYRGKGYGEAAMLERIRTAVTLNSDYLVKCTGRLYVRNIEKLLTVLQRAPDIVVRVTRDLSFADSRLFALRTSLTERLLGSLKDGVDEVEGAYMEHALARRVLKLASEGARVTTWPAPPYYVGRSASTGQRYDSFTKALAWPLQLLFYRLGRISQFP